MHGKRVLEGALQKIYGETECRCLSFEDETDLLAEMILLLVDRDEEKVKQAVEIANKKSESRLPAKSEAE